MSRKRKEYNGRPLFESVRDLRIVPAPVSVVDRKRSYSLRIPDGVLMKTFEFLPMTEVIRWCRKVCQKWNQLSRNQRCWTTHLYASDEDNQGDRIPMERRRLIQNLDKWIAHGKPYPLARHILLAPNVSTKLRFLTRDQLDSITHVCLPIQDWDELSLFANRRHVTTQITSDALLGHGMPLAQLLSKVDHLVDRSLTYLCMETCTSVTFVGASFDRCTHLKLRLMTTVQFELTIQSTVFPHLQQLTITSERDDDFPTAHLTLSGDWSALKVIHLRRVHVAIRSGATLCDRRVQSLVWHKTLSLPMRFTPTNSLTALDMMASDFICLPGLVRLERLVLREVKQEFYNNIELLRDMPRLRHLKLYIRTGTIHLLTWLATTCPRLDWLHLRSRSMTMLTARDMPNLALSTELAVFPRLASLFLEGDFALALDDLPDVCPHLAELGLYGTGFQHDQTKLLYKHIHSKWHPSVYVRQATVHPSGWLYDGNEGSTT